LKFRISLLTIEIGTEIGIDASAGRRGNEAGEERRATPAERKVGRKK
jgi:hypothetical protein